VRCVLKANNPFLQPLTGDGPLGVPGRLVAKIVSDTDVEAAITQSHFWVDLIAKDWITMFSSALEISVEVIIQIQIIRPFLLFWSILPFLSIFWVIFGLLLAICGNFSPFLTMFWAIFGNFWHFWPILAYICLFCTFWLIRLFQALLGPFKPF
jgi:hypothetical protein